MTSSVWIYPLIRMNKLRSIWPGSSVMPLKSKPNCNCVVMHPVVGAARDLLKSECTSGWRHMWCDGWTAATKGRSAILKVISKSLRPRFICFSAFASFPHFHFFSVVFFVQWNQIAVKIRPGCDYGANITVKNMSFLATSGWKRKLNQFRVLLRFLSEKQWWRWCRRAQMTTAVRGKYENRITWLFVHEDEPEVHKGKQTQYLSSRKQSFRAGSDATSLAMKKKSSAWLRHLWFDFMSCRFLETSAICFLPNMMALDVETSQVYDFKCSIP